MDVCENLQRIVVVTERDFGDMANALLPQIINLSLNTLSAIRQLGAKLLQKLSELVRYDLMLLKAIYMRSNQGAVVSSFWFIFLGVACIRD